MSLLAVTVVGHDRPGIIADVTAVLARLGANIEDSSMTLLRGHFAMTLVCATTSQPAAAAATRRALEPLAADGSLLVSVRELPDEPDAAPSGRPYVVTVHGGDRAGIVSAVTSVLAEAGGNVTDLTTRLSGELYVLVAEVDVPRDADADALAAQLRATGAELGVGVTLRESESDLL